MVTGTAASLPVVLVQTSRTEIGHADRLAARLGGRPVHELPSPPITETTMLNRVAAWVEVHAAALDDLGLGDDVALVGWSFGGAVAVELARLLREEGRPPAMVGLIDSIRPRIRPIRLREAVPYHLTEAAFLHDPAERRTYLAREGRVRVARRIRRLRGGLSRRVAAVRRTTPSYVGKPTDPAVRSIHRSYLNHVVEPVDFPVSLFVTQPSVDRCGGDTSLRWAPFLRRGFTVSTVPGGHHSLWDPPHLDGVAARIDAELRRADAARTS